MPFDLKNVRETFQHAMKYYFQDLKNIIEYYLDDLTAHSRKILDLSTHLRLIFERFHYYHIYLNPQNCILRNRSGRLLGFLVFEHGIMVDPMKVEAILRLPPPHNIRQLQSLQWKDNFFRQFIVNYANLTKGFMCLLKKGNNFIWDEGAHESFDSLKKYFVSVPLLNPPDYSRNYFLYITTTEGTVGVVLV
jgi:hypothetical protein